MAVDLKLGFKLGLKPSLKLGLKPKSNWALVWNWILVSRFSFGLKLEFKTLVLAKHKVTQCLSKIAEINEFSAFDEML